jgi:chemotaxis protein histidine kinase CheA
MKELHITELLRREGRADDTQRGGFTVGKLAVAASGGVVLCGSVAFAASSWLSSPNERPLAEVRFDERAQARGASAGTEGVVKLPSNKTQQEDAAETPQADPTTEQTRTRVAPYVQQQQQQPQRPATAQTPTQQPATQQPTPQTPPTASTPSTSPETSTPSTPPSSDTSPPPPPVSSSVAPPSSSTPPASNPLPTPSNPVDVSVDLGLLDPVLNTVGDTVGGFDFFTPVK